MSNVALMIGWSGTKQGHEKQALEKFGEFVGYLVAQQAQKKIDSFEPVFVRPHGGDLNGFFLVRADAQRLAVLRHTDAWKDWEAWGAYALEGYGVNECMIGDGVTDILQRFGKLVK